MNRSSTHSSSSSISSVSSHGGYSSPGGSVRSLSSAGGTVDPMANQGILIPIQKRNVSFFDPSWTVGAWDHFNPHMWDHSNFVHRMELQMKKMREHMDKQWASFHRLAPVGPTMAPMLQMQPGVHMMPMGNPPRMAIQAAGAFPSVEPMPISHPIINGSPGNEKMELKFDVREFHPSEIVVTTKGNMLSVRARHQERSESDTHKSCSWKEYNRQYLLPVQVDPTKINPSLSPEGILTIESRLVPAIEGKKKVRLAVEEGK